MKTQKHYSEQETKELIKIGTLPPSKSRKALLETFATKTGRKFGGVYFKMLSLGGKVGSRKTNISKTSKMTSTTNIDISGKTINIPIKSIQIVNSNLIIKY